jgi:pimeloyl-ACP methyl ester carboxylesterase
MAAMHAISGQAQLAYETTGGGDPVLLVHAGVTDRRSWRSVTSRLAPDHLVVAYDQRGYGETTYTPEPWSPVADAVAVLDAAGVDRAAVVGCSMGGSVAVDLALEHPERVSRLALIAPSITGGPWLDVYPEPVATLEKRLDAAEEAGDLAEMNRLEAWIWLDGPSAPEGRVGGSARDLFLDMNGKALANPDPGEKLRPPPSWDRLDQLVVPVLLLAGEYDLPDLLPVCQAALTHLPDARLLELPGTAHLPHLEDDEPCLEAITAFLHP